MRNLKIKNIVTKTIDIQVRETKCFSKKKPKLINSFELFHFYWNFMDKLTKTDTPAMLEGLADHQWNWEQFFNFNSAV
jgi:hypothetical protein